MKARRSDWTPEQRQRDAARVRVRRAARTPEQLEAERARDRDRERMRLDAMTPEQQVKAKARRQRAQEWREVHRAFERVMRLSPEVYAEARRRVDA